MGFQYICRAGCKAGPHSMPYIFHQAENGAVLQCIINTACDKEQKEVPFHQLPKARLAPNTVNGNAKSCLSGLDFQTSHTATYK